MSEKKQSKKRVRSSSQTAAARTEETYPDQSYLAYIRQVPRPFLRYTSGHFPPGTVTVPHSHPCLALHGCIQGPLIMLTPEGECRLDAGVFYIIAPGLRHSWKNTDRHTASTLGLLIDARHPGPWPAGVGMEAACRALMRLVDGFHRFATASDPELQRSYWLAADHVTAEESRDPIAISGTLLVLMGQIADHLRGDQPADLRELDMAQQIRRILLSRVQEQLSIEEITREVGVSPTRAKQAFRAAFGCGIITYFNQLKIWQAKRLLSNPAMSIEEVANHLGFSNPAYFTQAFLRHTNETPSAFRRSMLFG